MINTVKEQRDIEINELTGYLINNTIYVPIDKSNTHYQLIQEWIAEGNTPEPAFTNDERLNYFKEKKINELKQNRDSSVKQLVVTISNGIQLNGDETSQTRMTRAINVLPDDTTTIDWIDANNNLVQLTKPDLQEAVFLAGQEQTKIYAQYALDRLAVENAQTICEIYPDLEECK